MDHAKNIILQINPLSNSAYAFEKKTSERKLAKMGWFGVTLAACSNFELMQAVHYCRNLRFEDCYVTTINTFHDGDIHAKNTEAGVWFRTDEMRKAFMEHADTWPKREILIELGGWDERGDQLLEGVTNYRLVKIRDGYGDDTKFFLSLPADATTAAIEIKLVYS